MSKENKEQKEEKTDPLAKENLVVPPDWEEKAKEINENTWFSKQESQIIVLKETTDMTHKQIGYVIGGLTKSAVDTAYYDRIKNKVIKSFDTLDSIKQLEDLQEENLNTKF